MSLEMKCQRNGDFHPERSLETPLQLGPLGAESRKRAPDPDSPLPTKGPWWLTW